MGKKKYPKFKVIGSDGISIPFETREGAQQFLREKKKYNPKIIYNLIEYGNQRGKR